MVARIYFRVKAEAVSFAVTASETVCVFAAAREKMQTWSDALGSVF